MGVDLTDDEARDLARAGDLRSILPDLEQRLEVTRAVPGMADDPAFQQRLAVIEVVAAAAGLSATERGDIIRRTMVAHQARTDEAASAAFQTSVIHEQIEAIETSNFELRSFLRDVGRLYARQVSDLHRYMRDPAMRNDTIHRLNQIYARHLDLAVRAVNGD